MNIFFEEHIAILSLMISNDVKFLLIGGYAVIFHGYNRTTGDLDLWIEPTNENKLKLCKALLEAEFDPKDIDEISKMDFTKPIVFVLGTEPAKIDFVTQVNIVKFEDAYDHKIVGEFEGLMLPILHLNDLVLTKINTGRAKDTADIEELQRISNKN